MTLNQWSDEILILELYDEPDFSEDTDSLLSKLRSDEAIDFNVIIDLQQVSKLNSSNLGALVEIKKLLQARGKRMVVCNISDPTSSLNKVAPVYAAISSKRSLIISPNP